VSLSFRPLCVRLLLTGYNRDKYATIGESDRMTLKFIKKP
jgi:predicted methyltransferase